MIIRPVAVTRRQFAQSALAFAALAPCLRGAGASIDDTLRNGIAKRKIPCAVAMVATPDKVLYQGAFGTRDGESKMAVNINSIFAIASMTKAVTSAAALHLVDQGKLTLDEPVSKHLPQFAKLQVFEGLDANGKPKLRSVRTPVTLKHLLTHTSGFAYPQWSAEATQYEKASGKPIPLGSVAPDVPLIFEPGTRWQYGFSTDWTGRLVETVSGLTLEQYFQRNILQPLDMNDTSFILPAGKFDRLVSRYDRQPNGALKQVPRQMPTPPAAFNGGGGLFSTAGDYVKFMRMILNHGAGPGGKRILAAKTVEMMTANQIGSLTAGRLKSFDLARSSDVDVHPGANDGWGLGFLINRVAYDGGRSAGSLAWAGIANTFYWIDPKRNLCAALMMQFLPFVDKDAVAMLGEFERAVYATV